MDLLLPVVTVFTLLWVVYLHFSSRNRFRTLESSFFERDRESQKKLEGLETKISTTLDEISLAHAEQRDRDSKIRVTAAPVKRKRTKK